MASFVEIDGVRCQVLNDDKKNIVLSYQRSLTIEIDKYFSDKTMTESKKNYADALKANVKLAPFTFGWLKSPGDDEKLFIAELISEKEYKKRKLESRTKK